LVVGELCDGKVLPLGPEPAGNFKLRSRPGRPATGSGPADTVPGSRWPRDCGADHRLRSGADSAPSLPEGQL